MKTENNRAGVRRESDQPKVGVFYLTQKASRDRIAIVFYHLLSCDYLSESQTTGELPLDLH